MKRALILIIDSLGVGAMPDAPEYNDLLENNTLSNLARDNGGISLPNLGEMGIGNITEVKGIVPTDKPTASFGKMKELSKGKDSTTGHWEIAGLVSEHGFDTYPKGFPDDLMKRFVELTNCGGYYGNKPASGTAIIDEYHSQHKETGFPIIYTSADSVFQIACDVAVVPIDKLYKWCEIAREILDDGYNVSRVIARPYKETPQGLERIGSQRRDLSVPPPNGSLLELVSHAGGRVIGIGKTEDLFVGKGITHSIHTGSNLEGLEKTISVLREEVDLKEIALNGVENNVGHSLIFTNLVETDMNFGHRRDVKGYANALEDIDRYIPSILDGMKEEDLLIITADHGCDPPAPGSDHTREMVPLLVYSKSGKAKDLGTKESFNYVARIISEWFDLKPDPNWVS